MPPAPPVAETPAGKVLRYGQGGCLIPVKALNQIGGEGWPPRRRSYEETLYRADGGGLFLVRDSWQGRYLGARPGRHAYRVRRIGIIGALLWMLGHRSPSQEPEHLRREQRKLARQCWATINGKGATS